MVLKLCACYWFLSRPVAGAEVASIPVKRPVVRRRVDPQGGLAGVSVKNEIGVARFHVQPDGGFREESGMHQRNDDPVKKKKEEHQDTEQLHESVDPVIRTSFDRLLADIQRTRQTAMASGHCVRYVLHKTGLGSAINQMVKLMIRAHSHKEAACTENDHFHAALEEPEQTFKCGQTCANDNRTFACGRDLASGRVVEKRRREENSDSGEVNVTKHLQQLGNEYGLPEGVVRAAFTKYLLRPAPHVIKTKRERFAGFANVDIQTSGHYVAAHIRWGNKLIGEAKKVALRSYIVAAVNLAENLNVSNILLLSGQCLEIATELQKLWEDEYGGSCAQHSSWGMHCENSTAHSRLKLSMRVAHDCNSAEPLPYFSDFEMLRGAKGVVATLSSNLARLIWYTFAAHNVEDPGPKKILRTLDLSWHCAPGTTPEQLEKNGPCQIGAFHAEVFHDGGCDN